MSFKPFLHLDVPNKLVQMVIPVNQVVGEELDRRQRSRFMLKDATPIQCFVVREGPLANRPQLLRNG